MLCFRFFVFVMARRSKRIEESEKKQDRIGSDRIGMTRQIKRKIYIQKKFTQARVFVYLRVCVCVLGG